MDDRQREGVLALGKVATLVADRALRQTMASFLQNCSVRERNSDEKVVAVSCDLLRGDCDEVRQRRGCYADDRSTRGDGDRKLHLLHAESRNGGMIGE